MPPSFEWPIAIRTIDISRPLAPITGITEYSRVRVIVTRERDLIGSVDIWTHGAAGVSSERLGRAVADALGERIAKRQLTAQLSAATPPPPVLPPTTVSIVVPSCDRPDDLRRCLASLVAQQTRHAVEIVVVDNRPDTGSARLVAGEFPSVIVVDEPRPGLSFARNRGILAASGEIVVATDDDVTAPEHWIEELLEPFAQPGVMAVNGHVLPVQLETESQCRFEAYGGLGKGFTPFEVTGEWFRNRRTAVPTWELGATANAAFRASVFRHPGIGLLDEALGAGTPTGCSEDTYLFYRILKAGYTIVYHPSAYVWHRHRDCMTSLRQQIYAYSKGHVAYHLTTWLNEGDRRALVRLLYSLPKAYARRALERLRRRSDYPLSLILLEIRGNLAGPLALWRSRRRVRLLGQTDIRERSHAVPLEGQISQDPAA